MKKRIGTDGPGITDLVALAGCPLSCEYCINKEELKTSAYNVTPEKLLELVMAEACYFFATGGGVTFGGGEPLLQASGIREFAEIKPEWMKINIETSLNISSAAVSSLIPYVDRWIIDIKSLDKNIYKNYTGQDNDMVLSNLELLDKEKCFIRIPIIPGYKDKETAAAEESKLRGRGFKNIEVFEYIVKERTS